MDDNNNTTDNNLPSDMPTREVLSRLVKLTLSLEGYVLRITERD